MNSSHSAQVSSRTLREIVEELSREHGFDLAGVTIADSVPELDYFAKWIAEGRAGEMAWLEKRDEHGTLKRSSLQAALPWARSVIMCAASYDSAAPLSVEAADAGTGWIARYAQPGGSSGGPSDYHTVMLERLRAMEAALHTRLDAECGAFESRSYVDTGPLIERVYAQYAGLGWVGKNTCLIHPERGSWLFLAAIVTSIEIRDHDLKAALLPDRCGSCTRCIDACPTHALDEPYRMDASRCIAYLTIEKRGTIPEELRKGIGRQVFGCDICQDVCPWNEKSRRAGLSASKMFPVVRQDMVNPPLAWLGSLTREDFKRFFRGSPVERTKWRGLMRNVAVAMGNAGDAAFLPRLQAWSTQEEEPALAEAAQWAITKIGRAESGVTTDS